jgi:hypothetical protein
MDTMTFDILEYVGKLKIAGMSEIQAKVQIDALSCNMDRAAALSSTRPSSLLFGMICEDGGFIAASSYISSTLFLHSYISFFRES